MCGRWQINCHFYKRLQLCRLSLLRGLVGWLCVQSQAHFFEPRPKLCSFLPQFIVRTFRNVNAVVFVIWLQATWNIEAICTQCIFVNLKQEMNFSRAAVIATKKARSKRVVILCDSNLSLNFWLFPHGRHVKTRSQVQGCRNISTLFTVCAAKYKFIKASNPKALTTIRGRYYFKNKVEQVK